jgi:antitoxin CcdA
MSLQKSVARKKPVNLTLASELVLEARSYTPNLSETVEGLLEGFVLKERSARASRQSEANRSLAAWNSYGQDHITFADEFGRI